MWDFNQVLLEVMVGNSFPTIERKKIKPRKKGFSVFLYCFTTIIKYARVKPDRKTLKKFPTHV